MSNSKEISVSVLLKSLKKYLIYILIATIVLGTLGGLYAQFMKKTTYTAEAQFYIPNFSAGDGYVSDTLLDASESLAEVCAELVKKDDVLKSIAKTVKAEEYFGFSSVETIKALSSMISSSATGKGYISVSVTSPDPEFAFSVIQAIQNDFPDTVANIISTGEAGDRYKTKLHIVKRVLSVDEIVMNKPSVVKSGLLFAIIGFAASYCLALLLHLSDTKLRDPHAIKQNFKEPILATLPEWYTPEERKQRRKNNGRVSPEDTSKSKRQYKHKLLTSNTPFAVSESFSSLRTNLCYLTTDEKCPVFAVTSDFSAAGKSIVSANIAISLASLDKKVLLVECDMRCPDFNRIFETNVQEGLSEIISGNIKSYDSVLVADTKYENLKIMHSGRIPPNPSELLGSNKMKSIIAKWREDYDYVILDMPPVIEVADAGILASLISGYLIVARVNHSDLVALEDVTDSLDKVNGKILGYIVNGIDLKTGSSKTKYGKYSKYTKYTKYSHYSRYSDREGYSPVFSDEDENTDKK